MMWSVNHSRVLISACAALLMVGPAYSTEYTQPVEIEVATKGQCRVKTIKPIVGEIAVEQIAREKFSASDSRARAMGGDWRKYLHSDPEVIEKPEYRNGRCKARFRIDANDAAISNEIVAKAFCARPIAILTRVHFKKEVEVSEPLSLLAHQYLLDAFAERDFAVVDISEQTDRFRNMIREADSCAYVGGALNCEEREFTLSESILGILRSTGKIIEYYNEEDIQGDKYLPLSRGGVLNFVSMEVAAERSRVRVTATANSYRVDDRDIAWAIEPQTVPVLTRSISPEEATGKAFDKIAEKLARETALQCDASIS